MQMFALAAVLSSSLTVLNNVWGTEMLHLC